MTVRKKTATTPRKLLRNAKGYVKILYTTLVHCDCAVWHVNYIWTLCKTKSLDHNVNGNSDGNDHDDDDGGDGGSDGNSKMSSVKMKSWNGNRKQLNTYENGLTALFMTIALKYMWPAQPKWSRSVLCVVFPSFFPTYFLRTPIRFSLSLSRSVCTRIRMRVYVFNDVGVRAHFSFFFFYFSTSLLFRLLEMKMIQQNDRVINKWNAV